MPRWLLPGEDIVLSTRPHGSVLVRPALVVILVAALAGVASAWLSGLSWSASWVPWVPALWWVLGGAAGCAVLLWTLIPYVRWLGTRYILTTHRVVSCRGLLSRRQRDVLLRSIQGVQVSQSLSSRLVGAGDLLLTCSHYASAGQETVVVLRSLPRVVTAKNELLRQVSRSPAAGHGVQTGAGGANFPHRVDDGTASPGVSLRGEPFGR